MGKEFSAPSIARLDFVQYQYGIGFIAGLAQGLHKCGVRHLNAAHSLNAFDNHGTYISLSQFGFHRFRIVQRFRVVQREVSDVLVGIDRRDDFRVIGHFHC